jgi:hypothetical protein
VGPGEHRPTDEEYWATPWSSAPFAGDLFEAIPFGDQPIGIYEAEDEGDGPKHFLGEIAIGYGLLITPTCDMADQTQGGVAHPFRVLVPVLPLNMAVEGAGALESNVNLLRSRDTLTPYMYLPALAGVFDDEQVACLFRPTLVSAEFLASPPRRVAQLQPAARRHLKVKLAAYWGRASVEPNDLPLTERDEEALKQEQWPPSPYDPPDGPVAQSAAS